MTTKPLTVDEARRRLLARRSERRTPIMSRSQWLNEQARKDPANTYTKGAPFNPHAWTQEFEEMAARGLSRKEMVDELGLPWSTIQTRLEYCFNGHSQWPPHRGSRNNDR